MKHSLFISSVFGLLVSSISMRAQDAAEPEEEKKERVQYQLVLPDEKSPETVKPEEHNPFESETEAASRNSPGDTEENRVRDILMKLPVNGMSMRSDGRLRVLLGDIDLSAGDYVPQVLPDQLVELKVKSITKEYIELAWQEKQMVGLPPKIMIIPIDMEPSITYRMKGAAGGESALSRYRRGGTGISRNGLPVATGQVNRAMPPPAASPSQPEALITSEQPAPPRPALGASPAEQPAPQPSPAASSPPAVSPAIESAVRMLFGNPTPAPK